jgi:predicted protein tyrosine phosphatase
MRGFTAQGLRLFAMWRIIERTFEGSRRDVQVVTEWCVCIKVHLVVRLCDYHKGKSQARSACGFALSRVWCVILHSDFEYFMSRRSIHH